MLGRAQRQEPCSRPRGPAPAPAWHGDAGLVHASASRIFFGYSGSRLRAGIPQKLDDCSFTDIWRPGDRADILRLLHGIVAHGKPVLVGARHAHLTKEAEQAEILLLPTIEMSGEASLVGALAASRDWMTGSWPTTELALAAVSTPEQLLDRESDLDAAHLPGFRPLRPHLIAAPNSTANANTQSLETV